MTAKSCLAQPPDIRVVKPEGGETVVYSDAAHISDQSCPAGMRQYFVYRAAGRSAKTTFNLWRMTASGTNAKQITSGSADSDPFCSADGKWVYYVDYTDNQALKRVSLEGGSPETILSPANGITQLSPDGKTLVGFEVRELDHKLILDLYCIDDKKSIYHDVDQNANWPLQFAPDGKGVVYSVRGKGISNCDCSPWIVRLADNSRTSTPKASKRSCSPRTAQRSLLNAATANLTPSSYATPHASARCGRCGISCGSLAIVFFASKAERGKPPMGEFFGI